MTAPPTFRCSICGEESTLICSYCTKDACPNHLCVRCAMCSDCCLCELHSRRHLGTAEPQRGGPAQG